MSNNLVDYSLDETDVSYPGYNPSKPAALATGAIFVVVSVALLIRIVRRRTWWGLWLFIGTIGELCDSKNALNTC